MFSALTPHTWIPSALRSLVHVFMAHDLRTPLRHNERFDLVVCLEVAEHLPLSSAASLIQTLVDLGPVILFSAAIPGQGGLGHVNEQWPDYWAALFAQHGYRPIDCIRPRVWDDPRVEVWYAQNTILFASPHAIDHNSSFRTLSNLPPTPFSIVHPRLFLEPRRPTVRALMSAIKASLVGYAKRGTLALLRRPRSRHPNVRDSSGPRNRGGN